jgi:hypothetical protein
MIYYFKEDEWRIVWTDMYPSIDFVVDRVQYWNTQLKPKYKLIYTESKPRYNLDHWGAIEGDEKHINWFLLNL